MKTLRDKRVLVTGASGFLGQHLLRRLAATGAQVSCSVFSDESSRSKRLTEHCTLLRADIRDQESVFDIFQTARPEIVFHLAAVGVTKRNMGLLETFETNVEGTVHILEACTRFPVKRLIHTGTIYEHCDPATAYIASKLAAWAFVRAYIQDKNLPAVSVRLSHAYGPGQPSVSLVAGAILAALKGQNFKMTVGEQQRDFIYVDDLIEGMICAAIRPGIEGMTLDLGTGHGTEIRQVISLIYELVQGTGEPCMGVLPYRKCEVMWLVADVERTANALDWHYQVDLKDGLTRTIAWYRQEMEK
ncbi:MAG TPA: SDR family NAD(P)-dependent oxidoreductase [Chloroflexi bacterium]|nr:SDR family NAD(P)-dependent oxidoreductase [Chloroflexota bacterium]